MRSVGGKQVGPRFGEAIPIVVKHFGEGVVIAVPGVTGDRQIDSTVLVEVGGHRIMARITHEIGSAVRVKTLGPPQ